MSRINAKGPHRKRLLAERLASRKGHGWRCFYCRKPFTSELLPTFDHYVPYRLWPTGAQRNLVLACGPCNNAKADRLPLTFAWLLLAKSGRSDWGMAA